MTLDLNKINLESLSGAPQASPIIADQKTPLQSTLSEAIKVNPDSQVKLQKLSQQTGLPDFAIRGAETEVETSLKLNQIDLDGMVKRSPNTSKYLTDWQNASIAHDDIDVLEELEGLFRFGRTFENIGETTAIGFEEQATGILLRGADKSADRIVDLIPPSMLPIGVSDYSYQLSYDVANRMGIQTDEELQQLKEDAKNELVGQLQELQERRQALTPDDLNTLEQGVRAGIESLMNMAPGAALTVLTGGRAAPLLTTIGVQTFGQSYGTARAEGEDPQTASWYAGIDAAIEVGTEILPTGTLTRILTGNAQGKLTKEALKFTVQEMGTEQLATLGQSLNAYAFGLDEELEKAETIEEMVDIQLQRQAVTAIATVVAGGAQITAASTVRKGIEALNRKTEQQVNQGEAEQVRIDEINDAANRSKLKQRDPESFRKFLQEADGDQNSSVYIDGVQASLYLQGKSRREIESDPALVKLQEQAREAASLGGDVVIPVPDFAADIAGTEHFDALREHMTLSAETVTPFRQEQVREETQNYVQSLVEEAEQNASEYVESQQIYESVREQLIDTGMVSAQNAGVMAQVVPAWATVYARKNGITVQEAYQRSGLTITGPQTGRMEEVTGEQVLTQGFEYSADSPVYPMAPRAEWYGDADFADRGGRVVMVDPQTYIDQVRPLTLDEESQENIQELIDHIESGNQLDPLALYEGGQEDGRHRAYAALQLGIPQVPVIVFGDQSLPGEREIGAETSDLLAQSPAEPRNLFVAQQQNLLSQPAQTGRMEEVTGDQVLAEMPNIQNEQVLEQRLDYQIEHTPLTVEGGASTLDDLTGAFGEDIYDTRNALQFFGSGDPRERSIVRQMQKLRGNPDAEVTIYRGVPAEAGDINAGDWVTLSKEVAQDYADQHDGGKVISKKVKASEVTSWADSLLEFGYYPEGEQLAQPAQTGPEQARGYYNPANSMIRLTEAADLSTFLHEFAHFMYEMELATGSDTVQSIHNWFKRNAEAVAAEAGEYLREQRGDLEQAAFHGTPHRFDRFSLDAIGTGEGAQAYGWGLYFASNRGVAEWYRDQLTDSDVELNLISKDTGDTIEISSLTDNDKIIEAVDRPLSEFEYDATISPDVDEILDELVLEMQQEIDHPFSDEDDIVEAEATLSEIERIRPLVSYDRSENVGQLYQVDIPESDQLLDWDKPLSEQPEGVREKLLPYLERKIYDEDRDRILSFTGQDVYRDIIESAGNDEAASRRLNNLGIPGLRYLDATARGQQDGDSHNYVIWDEQAVTVEAVNDELVQAEQFAQSPEIPGDLPAGAINDVDVLNYLDTGSTGSQQKDMAIRRAVHEQFARGFETYLMEGKAPSIELRNAFRTFARWLTQIYQRIRGDLKVDLDNEMRQVFDRMLATEEQIQMAEARAKYAPLFTDAAMAGMTAEEWSDYQQRQQKVKDKQTETLREKLIGELTRQTKKWWKEEKRDIYIEERQRLQTERVYVARDRLKTGDIKLDRATVKEMVGEEFTDTRGRTFTRVPPALSGMHLPGAQGIHPDEAAGMLGYSSGAEMLDDMLRAPRLNEAADTRAEEIMKERHGDILNDGTIEQQADEAVQSEERGRFLLHELKILSRGTTASTFDRQAIKQLAEDRIAKLSFREINPGKYRKAEIKAAQEAARMLAENNREGAAQAKQRQVVNYYLGMAATDARNNVTKIVDRMARYNKKSVREEIQKAGNEYWEQLQKILERFEFRKGATLRQVEQLNTDINTWMRERTEQDGDALILTPAVLNESYVTHWKNVPYGELQGISDSVRNIEHVARYSNKITRLQEEMDFKTLVDRWVTSMDEKVESKFETVASVADQPGIVRKFAEWAMAQMTKIPYLASWLDGGERAGLSHQILVQPFTDAYDAEVRLWAEVGSPVLEAIQNRDKETIKRHNRKFFIPEIKGIAGHTGNLMGHEILAVALNTGNQSNLKKMLLGEGWANPEIESEISFDNRKLQAVLKHMTRSDWEMVQMIWDRMEMLYPQLADVHRRTTGLTPPKVEATPISIEVDGETLNLRGGYYPVKYDPNRSQRAQENEDKLNAETESMFSNSSSIQASVTAGATNERTGYYAPIRLSLDVVPAHFQETIHFITHHDAVREVNKLIRNKAVANKIIEKLGKEEFSQLRPWLNDIAKDGREAPTKMYWDSALRRLRFGVTLGAMGFKASTGIMQLFGLSNTIAEVGIAPVMQSVRSILGSTTTMRQAWEFARSNSKVLDHRATTMDREIKNAMRQIEGKRGILAAVQEASMKHIALIQTYMVDLPSWQAAYIKAMKEHGDETRAYQYADWVVENIQGSGVTKDMARIVRGQSETGRMFTMFMTFFSSLWNMERDLVRGARSGIYSRTTVAAKLAFIFFIPVYVEMLMRGGFGGDEDDEESKLQTYLTKTALYSVASVPFVRDIASAVGGDFGYNITPMQQVLEQGTRTIPELIQRPFTDEEITKGQVKGATKFIGAAVGIPGTGQAWATGEHLYQVLEEGEDLTLRELLFGPDKD